MPSSRFRRWLLRPARPGMRRGEPEFVAPLGNQCCPAFSEASFCDGLPTQPMQQGEERASMKRSRVRDRPFSDHPGSLPASGCNLTQTVWLDTPRWPRESARERLDLKPEGGSGRSGRFPRRPKKQCPHWQRRSTIRTSRSGGTPWSRSSSSVKTPERPGPALGGG